MIKAALRPEQTEREIAYELENLIRGFGGAGCAFPIYRGGGRTCGPAACRPDGPDVSGAATCC